MYRPVNQPPGFGTLERAVALESDDAQSKEARGEEYVYCKGLEDRLCMDRPRTVRRAEATGIDPATVEVH